MGKRNRSAPAKAKRTSSGHVRDVKIERVGPVTIYKRGDVYYLYYVENGTRRRPRVDGNLTVARATAGDVVFPFLGIASARRARTVARDGEIRGPRIFQFLTCN